MNRPPEITEDLWDVLTVRVAGAARLLPPSCDSDQWEGKLVKDTFEDGTDAARLLVLRCRDEGGKYSKGMRCTMEKSIATARKLLKLDKPKRKNSRAALHTLALVLAEADSAMTDATNKMNEQMEADE